MSNDAYRYLERSGGCQCGAIRFHATEVEPNPHLCYCRMCQKAAGNLFAAYIAVLKPNLVWTRGTPAEFLSSDHAARGFCAQCGTHLYYRGLASDGYGLSIGAFDAPETIPILFQIGTEAKHPSLLALDTVTDLGATEVNDPEPDLARIRATNHQHPDHDTASWPN